MRKAKQLTETSNRLVSRTQKLKYIYVWPNTQVGTCNQGCVQLRRRLAGDAFILSRRRHNWTRPRLYVFFPLTVHIITTCTILQHLRQVL